jgi:L-seryl-tRNA(Ser) seleniumtransferase
MSENEQPLLRAIPSVDALLAEDTIAARIDDLGRGAVVGALRSAASSVRKAVRAGRFEGKSDEDVKAAVAAAALAAVEREARPFYRRAINASGIILHTGLGRAVLAERAVRQIADNLAGYSLLQLDAGTGKRGKRDGRIEELLTKLTGAEAATIVNNNAAATLLVLNTVGAGKEVIVSRGQLVEIGGAFRLPEVFAASGATMVEVGTTNRTHPADYVNAITENTAAILRCHPSNYRIEGFASETPLDTLVKIAKKHKLTLIDDVGAGALVDFSRFGFAKEPTLPESVAAGADIVTSSADKLIGASQGGVILGRKKLIRRIRRNPLWRAMRVGKLTLAAAEATLSIFADEALVMRELPTVEMVMRKPDELRRAARSIARAVKRGGVPADVFVVDGFSRMGSGSLPGQDLPTSLVSITPHGIGEEELAARLRDRGVPVFARISRGALLLDPRTLRKNEARELAEALIEALVVDAAEQ